MIRIVETDGDVVELAATTPSGEIRVITDWKLAGRELILNRLHLDGPGAGSLGLQMLRDLAREFGRQCAVDRVIIHGGVRTTGANPGHVPRPIVILVGE
jgi:filamentous hemagglutinin